MVNQIGERWRRTFMPAFDMARYTPRIASSVAFDEQSASQVAVTARDPTFLQMTTVFSQFDNLKLQSLQHLRDNPSIRSQFFDVMTSVVKAMANSDSWRTVHARVVLNEPIDAIVDKAGSSKRKKSNGEKRKGQGGKRSKPAAVSNDTASSNAPTAVGGSLSNPSDRSSSTKQSKSKRQKVE